MSKKTSALYFTYSEKETEYLKAKDKKLCKVIEHYGHIYREITPDIFTAIVKNIVGQQISSKAFVTVWGRFEEGLKTIDAPTILSAGADRLQSFGISFRKAGYIIDFAEKVDSKEFDIKDLPQLSDEELIKKLSSLKGIGKWTAQMLMIFSLERQDVLSYDDLAICRGLCLLYHHKKITKKLFEKYRKRYSPYGTIASLYLWALAGDAETITEKI